jgi:hypothetical protein
MRFFLVSVSIAALALAAVAQAPQQAGQAPQVQQPAMPTEFGNGRSTGDKVADMFQAKIKAEWEAIKNKDKKAYGDLLADEYEGVELDGRGERNKTQAVNELPETNVANYTLFGFKMIPAGPDSALLIYEVNMLFPPRSVMRFSRVYITEFWQKRGGEWKEVHYQETHVK